MIEQDNHKNKFTVEDIERYHAGNMTAHEMHLLEKAALDDPFLADALEGYSYTQTPTADVQFLKNELQSRQGSNKVVVLPTEKTRNQLWKIAALFILVAGLGWAVYQFSFKNEPKNIAVRTPSLKQENADTTNYAIPDKPTGTSMETATAEVKDAPVAKASKKVLKANKQTAADTEDELITKNNRAGYAPSENNNSVALSAPVSSEKKAVADESLESKAITPADTNAFKARSFSEAPQANSRKENIIVLQRAKDSTVQEVVLGKSKKDSSYRKPKITLEEAEPKDDHLSYDDYVAQILQLPEIEKFKTTSREVHLSFDIDEAGQAVNIHVEKSLCDECDKEAIRILKEGPKLVKKQKNKKGRLSIRF